MSVLIDVERLRRELSRRGWGQCDLARAAGISAPTVTAAVSGKAIAPRTLRLIAIALSSKDPIPGVDELLPGQ